VGFGGNVGDFLKIEGDNKRMLKGKNFPDSWPRGFSGGEKEQPVEGASKNLRTKAHEFHGGWG